MSRTSLYFSPESWWAMNNMLSLTALSGRPVLELPTMNDLIEDMVIFSGWVIDAKPDLVKDLMSDFEGDILSSIKSNIYPTSGSKGRMAFNVSKKTQIVLDRLNSVKDQLGRKLNNGTNHYRLTTPMLIRNCVNFVLNSPYLFDFFTWFYISSLYGLTLFIKQFNVDYSLLYLFSKEEMSKLTEIIPFEDESSKDSLRLIPMDQEVIFLLDKTIEHMMENQREITPSKDVKYDQAKMDIELRFNSAKMKGTEYASRYFNFNYYEAASGYYILSHFNPLITTLPEIISKIREEPLRSNEDDFLWIEHFLSAISLYKQIGIEYNGLILRHGAIAGETAKSRPDTEGETNIKSHSLNDKLRLMLSRDKENEDVRLFKDSNKKSGK
jgi:hypothetical protein